MDYFKVAFAQDEDAAVKYALSLVFMDNRIQELAELVIDGSQLGGMGGDPGWLLERRDATEEGNEVAYPGWPAGARFMASVDKEAYRLHHSEYFMSREVFLKYIMSSIDSYVIADPSRATDPSVIAIRKAIA